MTRLLIGLLPLVGVTFTAQAEIFRCQTNTGVSFADQPCGEDAQPVEIRDSRIGGRLDQNLPEPLPTPEPSAPASTPTTEISDQATCRFINSTDLRRYVIRKQVVRGMAQEDVRRAFGPPPETHRQPQEVWVYQTRYYGALRELTYVYFKDGCVAQVQYRKP